MAVRRRMAMLFVIAAVVTAPAVFHAKAAAATGALADSALILERRIEGLRKEARHGEALELARRLLALRQQAPDAKEYLVADATRLLEKLEFIAALPETAQQELAEVPRLHDASAIHYMKGEYAEAAALAEQQLDILKRHLGDEHTDVATVLNNLALFLQEQGDYDRAEMLYREALAMKRKLLGDEHPDVAKNMSNLGVLLQKSGNVEEAESLCRRSLTMKRNLLGDQHLDVAKSLNNLGAILVAKGDFAEAERLLRDALAMYRKSLGDMHPDVAASLVNLAYLFSSQGAYEAAEPLCQEALSIFTGLFGEEHPFVALTLSNIAGLFYQAGDFARAERLHRDALAMRQSQLPDDHPRVIESLSNLAVVLQRRGRYSEAEDLLRRALDAQWTAKGDKDPSLANCLNNLAAVLRDKGEYVAAEPLMRKAVAISREVYGPDHSQVAHYTNNLGALLQDSGDRAGAEPLFREALAIFREIHGDEHPKVAFARNNLARSLQSRGSYSEAEALLREALAALSKHHGKAHPDVALFLGNLAALLHERGDLEDAERLHREALAMRRELLGVHPQVAVSLSNLASVLEDAGNFTEAESLYREALAVDSRLLGDKHPVVAGDLTNLALLLSAQGDLEGAQELLANSAQAYDVARLRASSGLARATFGASPYRPLAGVRLRLGRKAEAWEAVERSLGRALADLLLTANERPLTASEAAREDSLRIAVGDLERQLDAYMKAAESDTTGRIEELAERTRTWLLAAEGEWSACQAEIATKYRVEEGQPYPLNRIQASLSDGRALIGWLDLEERKGECTSWVYVIRESGHVKWTPIAPASAELPSSQWKHCRALREAVTSPTLSPARLRTVAHHLWKERIAPVVDTLAGVEDLIVIPSGEILGIPVEVLVDDDGVYVGERFAVSYVPSATIHAWLSAKTPTRGKARSGRALIIGDPPFTEDHLVSTKGRRAEEDYGSASPEAPPDVATLRDAICGNDLALAALPRLPASRQEAEDVAACFSEPMVLVGADAAESELVRMADTGELGTFGIIHIATHALVDDERPEQSALVLSLVGLPDPLEAAMAGTRIYDGLVTAKEIVREWELDADLVTLSACRTGLGKVVGGEGYVGFSHAFFQAGARSVLVSLRKVQDRATALLMVRFYENYLGRYDDERAGMTGRAMSKAKALQEAKRWLRTLEYEDGARPFEHPYYWSPFILIGDPR